jgi:putative transposase
MGRVEVTQAYRYRIDPSTAQLQALSSHLGGSRFMYNHLRARVSQNWAQVKAEKEASGDGTHVTEYLSTSHFGFLYQWSGIRDEVAPWWGENSAQAYNDAAQKLSKAFANFRQGRAGFPAVKRKQHAASVKFSGTSFSLHGRHHVRLSRVGLVKTYESMRKLARRVENGTARVVTATVRRESGGWFVAFMVVVQRPDPPPPRTPADGGNVIGLDLGLTTLVTGASPHGEVLLEAGNPRNYRLSEARLAKAQRVASRRRGPVRGVAPSNRWRRANKRVQGIHANVANQRSAWQHALTRRIAKQYDVIVVEDLAVANMVRNRTLAKAIHDAGWGELVRQLEYKAGWYGATVVKAGRFYPSSKTCSGCGTAKAKLSLSEREFHCTTCGTRIGRDVNAAINLARLGDPGWETRTAGTRSVAGRGGSGKTKPKLARAGLGAARACEASTVTHV